MHTLQVTSSAGLLIAVVMVYALFVLGLCAGAFLTLWAVRRACDWWFELIYAYDRLRLGVWVYLACRARQKVRPLNLGTYEIMDPTERMRRSCAQLIELAEETGQVVTITTEPVWGSPPAMGNYTMEFHVRPARIDGKYGGTT